MSTTIIGTITNHDATPWLVTFYSCGRGQFEKRRCSYSVGHVGCMHVDIDMNEIVPVQNWGAANG